MSRFRWNKLGLLAGMRSDCGFWLTKCQIVKSNVINCWNQVAVGSRQRWSSLRRDCWKDKKESPKPNSVRDVKLTPVSVDLRRRCFLALTGQALFQTPTNLVLLHPSLRSHDHRPRSHRRRLGDLTADHWQAFESLF